MAGLARSTNPRHSAGAAGPESGRIYQIGLHTRFRGVTVRQGLVWRGEAGWAEWSPFLDYGPDEARIWLASGHGVRRDRLAGSGAGHGARELHDSRGGRRGRLPHGRGSGCTTAKVKVAEHGQALADDLDRVEAVRHALGPTGRVRVDANGAWDVDTARAAIRQLARFDLEYVEQPCAHVEELADLRLRLARDGIDVLIAADESIRRSSDPYRVAELRAADVVVLKVQPLGGVRACLEIAERIGLPVVVSSALETSVGIRAGLALAAALPELPYACGLNTVPLLTDDLVESSLVATGGYLGFAISWSIRCGCRQRRHRWTSRRRGGHDFRRFAVRWPRWNPARAELPSASQCARALIAELISWGVRDVVLAPGSRSAPLAYEVFEADRTGQLRLHVRIDERTGAFLALGLAKASGRVVPVITTSGTAAANLHPAVWRPCTAICR